MLTRVTIEGDLWGNARELAMLSRQYPFVEWGLVVDSAHSLMEKSSVIKNILAALNWSLVPRGELLDSITRGDSEGVWRNATFAMEWFWTCRRVSLIRDNTFAPSESVAIAEAFEQCRRMNRQLYQGCVWSIPDVIIPDNPDVDPINGLANDLRKLKSRAGVDAWEVTTPVPTVGGLPRLIGGASYMLGVADKFRRA